MYRSKFVHTKNPEFLDRLMYHDISILYKFLKSNSINKYTVKLDKKKKLYEVFIKFRKKRVIRFTYNLNSKKKNNIINNYQIKSKKDLLNKMIYNVIYDKVNLKENNLKALFIIKFLNKIRKKANHAH